MVTQIRNNIIWFNPPFNLYSATNIGRIFRDLVDKHFSRGNDLGKLFNKNKLKVSYKCLPNIKAKISSHNRHILNKDGANETNGGCNCQRPLECPMDGECSVSDIVYRAKVVKTGDLRGSGHYYVGMASGRFKTRYNNHTKSFRNEKWENETELSKFVWSLKRKGVDFKVHFQTLSFEKPFKLESGKCQMCLKEKVEIIKNLKENGPKSINRRWEVFRRCLHRGKHLLGAIDTRETTQRDHYQIGDRDREESLTHRGVGIAGERDRGRGVLQNDQKMLWGHTRSGKNWRELD